MLLPSPEPQKLTYFSHRQSLAWHFDPLLLGKKIEIYPRLKDCQRQPNGAVISRDDQRFTGSVHQDPLGMHDSGSNGLDDHCQSNGSVITIDRNAHLAYVEQFLAPTLAAHAIVADTICNCVQLMLRRHARGIDPMTRTTIWLLAVLLASAMGLPNPAAADATFEFTQTSSNQPGAFADATMTLDNAAFWSGLNVNLASPSLNGLYGTGIVGLGFGGAGTGGGGIADFCLQPFYCPLPILVCLAEQRPGRGPHGRNISHKRRRYPSCFDLLLGNPRQAPSHGGTDGVVACEGVWEPASLPAPGRWSARFPSRRASGCWRRVCSAWRCCAAPEAAERGRLWRRLTSLDALSARRRPEDELSQAPFPHTELPRITNWKLASQRLLAAAPSLQEIDGRSFFHLYSQPPLAELMPRIHELSHPMQTALAPRCTKGLLADSGPVPRSMVGCDQVLDIRCAARNV